MGGILSLEYRLSFFAAVHILGDLEATVPGPIVLFWYYLPKSGLAFRHP
jgi:hypothetical protein